MGARSTAVLNVPLTTYAQGIAQNRLAAYRLANLLVPIVKVAAAYGTYKKYDDRNDFLIEDTERPIGGPRKRLTLDKTDGTYNCKPHGLEIGKDDFESDLAGGDAAGMALDQEKISSMLGRKATAYVSRAITHVSGALTAESGLGEFSNPNVDPIDQIDKILRDLAIVCSSTENINLVMGLTTWSSIRANPKVKSRLGLKTEIALTQDMFLSGLIFRPANIEISAVSLTSTKRGQSTVTKSEILSGYVIAAYSVPNPTKMDASAFKCFSTSDVLVESVRTFRDEHSNSDIHAIDWSEDIQTTGLACAKLIAVT